MNNRFLCGFEFIRFQVFERDSDGRPNVLYKVRTPGYGSVWSEENGQFLPNPGVIFQGKDFSPPLGTDPTGKESRCHLLCFLTLKPGDTDKEYFEKYTPEQLEWANSWENEDASVQLMEMSEEMGID